MLQVIKDQYMDYHTFIHEITNLVEGKMGKGYSARVYKILKNNSLELDSLVVLKESKNFAPNIYLMPYFEAYLEGTSLSELAERICGSCVTSAVPTDDNNFTFAFSSMKPYIVHRLINYEKNRKLLDRIPHIRYLDLAVTYHCLVRNDEQGIGTIRITNDHLDVWETDVNEISLLAGKNTSRIFPAEIRCMDEVIRDLIGEGVSDIGEGQISGSGIPDQQLSGEKKRKRMYILTNQKGINGASCMLYEHVLKRFSRQIQSDFYILPSSIHEIILVPYHNKISKEALCDMVKEVNLTQVLPEEVLSDQVYLYSADQNAIIM